MQARLALYWENYIFLHNPLRKLNLHHRIGFEKRRKWALFLLYVSPKHITDIGRMVDWWPYFSPPIWLTPPTAYAFSPIQPEESYFWAHQWIHGQVGQIWLIAGAEGMMGWQVEHNASAHATESNYQLTARPTWERKNHPSLLIVIFRFFFWHIRRPDTISVYQVPVYRSRDLRSQIAFKW